MRRQHMIIALAAIAAALLSVVLILPLVALVAGCTPAELVSGLQHPLTAPALRLSALTSLISLTFTVAGGTPLAWWLSRAEGRGVGMLEVALRIPVVTPPAVAGVALLLAFGRNGAAGSLLSSVGAGVTFTTAAVVIAQVFVSAPFYVQAATAAFRELDDNQILASRSLGADGLRSFFAVALPAAWPALAGGAALAWARAIGEFGATLLFAGNLSGRTQTMPLAIYTALESDLQAAQALSVVLVAAAFGALLALRAFERAPRNRRTHRRS